MTSVAEAPEKAGHSKCPCGISLDLEVVELQASGGYSFRGKLCPEDAAKMRGYWDERFHGQR